MMNIKYGRFALLSSAMSLAGVLCLLPAPGRAQDTPVIAYIAASGTVTVRRKDNDKVVATIAPALFEQTWQFRSLGSGEGFLPISEGMAAGGSINAATADTQVQVRTACMTRGNRLMLHTTFSPTKPVAVNSVQVSVNVSASAYRGAAWAADSKTGIVPATAKETQLVAGVGSLTIGDGAKKISVAAPESTLLLQDGSVFNGADLEIRAGKQGERTLAAGTTETVNLNAKPTRIGDWRDFC